MCIIVIPPNFTSRITNTSTIDFKISVVKGTEALSHPIYIVTTPLLSIPGEIPNNTG